MNSRQVTFIGLNAVRVLSIISIILVFSSSIVVLVHDVQAVNRFVSGEDNATNGTQIVDHDYIPGSTVPNQPAGAFWAVLNRLLIIGQLIMLFLAELGWPTAFFANYFPVLGDDFGLGALGIIQCLLGATILSHHVDEFSLVSAFFLFSIGCLNMLCGLVWRKDAKIKRSLTVWREQKKPVLPTHQVPTQPPFLGSRFSGTTRASVPDFGFSRLGFGRQGEKAAAMKGFLIDRPVESLPTYHARPVASSSESLGKDSVDSGQDEKAL